MNGNQVFDVNLGTLDEFYDSCDSETDFDHVGIHYEVVWGEDDGWDLYYMPEDFYMTNRKWYETAPKEHFKDLCDMVFMFRLKNDGRTIAEYICDCLKIPRYAVPVPPKFVNDKKRKH